MRRNQQTIGHPDGRPTCFLCMRPETHCVCKLVSPFMAHCNILILQHPHERKKYYGTAKLALRALTNAKLLRGIQFEEGEIERATAGRDAYVLYPSKDAVDCETVSLSHNSTVIVIDGTWPEAGKIIHRNPYLKKIPALTFKRDIRSQYRIRKQPKDYCLSTIECIGHLLKLNAQATHSTSHVEEYDRLFEGFDRMIEQQLMHFPRMAQ